MFRGGNLRNFLFFLMICCFGSQASESKLMQTAYFTTMSISEFTQTQRSLETVCTEKAGVSKAFSNLLPAIEVHLTNSIEIMEHFQATGRKLLGKNMSKAFAEHEATIANKVEKTLHPFTILSHSNVVLACENWQTAVMDSNSQIMKRFYDQADFITNNKTAIINAIDNSSNW
jgi:hypothetical protein